MREIPRSPSEYYVRFLISAQDSAENINANEIVQALDSLGLDGFSASYVREVAETMLPRPLTYDPGNFRDTHTTAYLKQHKIFDMWRMGRGVRESQLILIDQVLREKLEPLLLSSMGHSFIARKLRRYTSIALTPEGVSAFGHYFWNRGLLTQPQWMEYLKGKTFVNAYIQGLMLSPDVVGQHLPYAVGITGPGKDFNSAEAASRIGQIAYKHALELEHCPATLEVTMAVKNCMTTVMKADELMRRSDVALRDVLRQFEKFRMRVDDTKVEGMEQLAGSNYSKSGEGTDVEDDENF